MAHPFGIGDNRHNLMRSPDIRQALPHILQDDQIA
jgi:hypothetical protein